MRSSSNSGCSYDLDTMRTQIVNNTTKLKDNKPYSVKEIYKIHMNVSYCMDRYNERTHKKVWNSKLKNHSVNVVIETSFGSLSEFMTKGKYSTKYVTRVIRTPNNSDVRTKQINGFKNLVTIMRDYNCCLLGLAEYLTLPHEDVVEMVENRASNTLYSREAICYALMNDCVVDEHLLDYSATKLTLFRQSINHFCKKYNCDLEYIMDGVNNAI